MAPANLEIGFHALAKINIFIGTICQAILVLILHPVKYVHDVIVMVLCRIMSENGSLG